MTKRPRQPTQMREEQPELVVGAIIENGIGEILLIRQRKWTDQYSCFVGGHVKRGERIEGALRREVQEEVGLPISDLRLIGYGESIAAGDYERMAHMVFLNFICSLADENTPVILGDEIQEVQWRFPEDALPMVMRPNVAVLEELLAKGELKCTTQQLKVVSGPAT